VYSLFRGAALALLRLPSGPPTPPPGGSVVRTFNPSRRYLHYRLIGVWIGAGIFFAGAVGLAVGSLFDRPGLLVGAGVLALIDLVILVVSYVINRLEFEMRYYILTDRSVRIREGVIFLRESTLTFANVQNLRIKKGPIQQLFGIADVLVDTAGGAGGKKDAEGKGMEIGHRGKIQGIENPTEIRDLVLGLLKKYRDAGLGDPEDAARAAAAADDSMDVLRDVLVEVKALRAVLTR
jgi:uncharacterized membrane protein YdbT with pleckstrin-like domain